MCSYARMRGRRQKRDDKDKILEKNTHKFQVKDLSFQIKASDCRIETREKGEGKNSFDNKKARSKYTSNVC